MKTLNTLALALLVAAPGVVGAAPSPIPVLRAALVLGPNDGLWKGVSKADQKMFVAYIKTLSEEQAMELSAVIMKVATKGMSPNKAMSSLAPPHDKSVKATFLAMTIGERKVFNKLLDNAEDIATQMKKKKKKLEPIKIEKLQPAD